LHIEIWSVILTLCNIDLKGSVTRAQNWDKQLGDGYVKFSNLPPDYELNPYIEALEPFSTMIKELQTRKYANEEAMCEPVMKVLAKVFETLDSNIYVSDTHNTKVLGDPPPRHQHHPTD